MGDRGSIGYRNITGINGIIPGFTISNSQNILVGEVNQAIAAALSQDHTLVQNLGSLLASRVAETEGQGPRPAAHIVPAASQGTRFSSAPGGAA
jgi:hypothetical protein